MIKIAFVEDNPAVADALEEVLGGTGAFQIVFIAHHGLACLQYLAAFKPESQPEVVLMDIAMPKMDGIEATRQISALYPLVQILMLTTIEEDEKIFEAIKAGAKGYLLKTESTESISRAIREVREGGTSLTPSIARKVFNFLQNTASKPMVDKPVAPAPYLLTERETEILQLLAQGFAYQTIAEQLHIAMGTLKKHTYNIYEKLQVSNRTQAIEKYKNR